MGISPEHLPVLVPGHQCHLLDGQADLEQAAGAFMAQVVEMQVFNPEFNAGAAERGPDGAGIVGENAALVRGAPALRQSTL